jgi:hypothetical protein
MKLWLLGLVVGAIAALFAFLVNGGKARDHEHHGPGDWGVGA